MTLENDGLAARPLKKSKKYDYLLNYHQPICALGRGHERGAACNKCRNSTFEDEVP
eukprot:CAMPEP_0183440096 /NCGR_PEP_ID=MMETSP0370-20130417/80277_1 /TAXON_ID=268820 /ORGANISM="Peridinium aciculiferum, Strain PAER-2" /LENGTH=55 /DNA_ID=CAMNT_0025628821 /DNA_START=192 /DNA_END=356 /DNA_ORIENTATION=-